MFYGFPLGFLLGFLLGSPCGVAGYSGWLGPHCPPEQISTSPGQARRERCAGNLPRSGNRGGVILGGPGIGVVPFFLSYLPWTTPILEPTFLGPSKESGASTCRGGLGVSRAPPCQVPPVHLADSCFLEGSDLDEAREQERKHVKAVIKRRLGQPAEEPGPPPKKRRRLKSYVTLMQIDNMLRTSASRRLSDYIAPLDGETGQLSSDVDLWRLPSLSLATDSGPDCVVSSGCFLIT